jgi:hypothetical protein
MQGCDFLSVSFSFPACLKICVGNVHLKLLRVCGFGQDRRSEGGTILVNVCLLSQGVHEVRHCLCHARIC